MKILTKWFISALAIIITSYLLSGVHLNGIFAAIMVALILGLINTFIRPILIILTLPATILTVGLFIFIINALLVMLTSAIVKGFQVDNFGWALLFSLVLTLINSILHEIFEPRAQ